MRPNDRGPNTTALALIVLLALALGPGVAAARPRALTGRRRCSNPGEDLSAPPFPAPVRTLDR